MNNLFEQQNRGKGRGSNLTPEDRAAGGRTSARSQKRDSRGQFAGKGKEGNGSNTREQNREQNE